MGSVLSKTVMKLPAPHIPLMLVLATVSWSAAGQSNQARIPESMVYVCDEKPFLSVAARTKDRDVFPTVDLSISDPAHRTQGERRSGAKIPESRYGRVVQIPKMPQHSKALAIEICNAEQGPYELTVEEHGNGAYVLAVSGSDDTRDTNELVLYHIAKEGRILHYEFTFRADPKQIVVNWLDPTGQEQSKIESSEW